MTALYGKSALVTGGSGGIGGAIARRLAADGAAVTVHYRSNEASAAALAGEITAAGGSAQIVGGDVTDAAACAHIAKVAAREDGLLDILVNNAGTLANLPFGSITAETFHEQFGTNVLGMILMTQAAAAYIPAGGSIINIGTNIATSPLPGTAVYSAAKAAVATLTTGFARELGPRRIRVNAIAPGATETAMLGWITDEGRAGIADMTPLGRIGQPDDIAGIAAFLAASDSGWITGRTIIADGGLI